MFLRFSFASNFGGAVEGTVANWAQSLYSFAKTFVLEPLMMTVQVSDSEMTRLQEKPDSRRGL